MSEQQPGPTHQPYGQSGGGDPYGQPSPYGQPPAYGSAPRSTPERRPGTVTAAAWITIVLSAITATLFGFTGLALVVARDQFITAMEGVPDFEDANIDADSAVGLLVAVTLGLVVWCLVAIVLAVMVMRRSGVARILLVISASVTALISLVGITSGVPIVPLVAAIATIVLLFTGGAGDWFKRAGSSPGGYAGAPTGYPGGPYGGQSAGQYAGSHGSQPSPDAAPQYPSGDNPYGQPSGTEPYGQQPPPGAENPYGQQPPTEGGTDHPPRDYPDR